MTITLSQIINVEGDKFPHCVFKEFDSVVVPHIGCTISDSVWKDPYDYKVIEVNINYQKNECLVFLEAYKYPVDSFEEYLKIAKLHGWYSPLDDIK